MTEKTTKRSFSKRVVRILVRTALTVLIVFVTILLVRAFDARGLPDLQVWHKADLTIEFDRRQYTPQMTFDHYEAIEIRLFEQLEKMVYDQVKPSQKDVYNRYNRASLSSHDRFNQNWNRSFELVPENVEGGILLLHGLTDSPYSMRTLASLFHEADFYVLALRMPAHGTIPGALTEVSWKDWMAAAKVGARHVRQKVGPDRPFYIAGYSNGGAVSLLHTLDSLDSKDSVRPDRVFLFSPAIGITKFAAMARWLKVTAVIPYFEKSKWKSIGPEYDPFKYNSFPLNAAQQSYNLAKNIHKSVLDHQSKGTLSKLPPIMTFQSVVDSTVIAEDIITRVYSKLSPNDHEVVAFDTNRNAHLKHFMKTPELKALSEPRLSEKLPFTLTVITNKDPNSQQVIARTKHDNTTAFVDVPLDLSWPRGVYSLSHVALPFPVNDPLYGTNPPTTSSHVQLGNIRMRGERGVMRISERDVMRLRCNPFWDYVANRLKEVVRSDLERRPVELKTE